MAKLSTKKQDSKVLVEMTGKELLEKSKEKVNKEKQMNKSNKKTIIVTVLLTIVSIATIAGLLYTGFTLGRGYEKGLQNEVANQVTVQVKELATATTLKK